jgi:hypothetical protein
MTCRGMELELWPYLSSEKEKEQRRKSWKGK